MRYFYITKKMLRQRYFKYNDRTIILVKYNFIMRFFTDKNYVLYAFFYR